MRVGAGTESKLEDFRRQSGKDVLEATMEGLSSTETW